MNQLRYLLAAAGREYSDVVLVSALVMAWLIVISIFFISQPLFIRATFAMVNDRKLQEDDERSKLSRSINPSSALLFRRAVNGSSSNDSMDHTADISLLCTNAENNLESQSSMTAKAYERKYDHK
jgi:hypothetical protein